MNAIEDKAMPETRSTEIDSPSFPCTPVSVNTLPLRTALIPPSDAAFQLISVDSTNLLSFHMSKHPVSGLGT